MSPRAAVAWSWLPAAVSDPRTSLRPLLADALVVSTVFAPAGPILFVTALIAFWASLMVFWETSQGVMCSGCGSAVGSTNRVYQRDHFFKGELATLFTEVFDHAVEIKEEYPPPPPIRTERGHSVRPGQPLALSAPRNVHARACVLPPPPPLDVLPAGRPIATDSPLPPFSTHLARPSASRAAKDATRISAASTSATSTPRCPQSTRCATRR